MPDDDKKLGTPKTFMWIEPNHPIAPPGAVVHQTYPDPPKKMPPVQSVVPKNPLSRA